MSETMMKGLVVFYVLVTITCLLEKKYPWALYWACAAGITTSVIWMKQS